MKPDKRSERVVAQYRFRVKSLSFGDSGVGFRE